MTRNEEIADDWRARLQAAGVNSLADLLRETADPQDLPGHWEALQKPGLGGRQRWRWEFDNGSVVLYLKRYQHTPLKSQLDRMRRQCTWHSQAWWEYRQSQRFAADRIPATRAVGFAEQMNGTLEARSAVLLERVTGDGFDREWQRACAANAPITHGPARQDIARRLARFVAAFHQTGFCHRDLYLCHVFVELDHAGTRPPTFTLIDLARTHRPRWRRMRWIIKDLAQLDYSAQQIGASRSDRLRFLLAYLALPPRAARVRWYARRISRKSDSIRRHAERKSKRA